MCIDNTYIRKGDIEPDKLFKKIDVTEEVKTTYSKTIEDNVAVMVKAIAAKTFIEIGIGTHCNDPYDCPLIDKCWSFLPERCIQAYRTNKLPLLDSRWPFELAKIQKNLS